VATREQAGVLTTGLLVVRRTTGGFHAPMANVSLTRLTSFDYGQGIGYLEVWVNGATIAYCQPRRRYDSKSDTHSLDGTLIFFQEEAGVLAVKEPLAEVVRLLSAVDPEEAEA
jgi:hypothetical protein